MGRPVLTLRSIGRYRLPRAVDAESDALRLAHADLAQLSDLELRGELTRIHNAVASARDGELTALRLDYIDGEPVAWSGLMYFRERERAIVAVMSERRHG